MTLNLEHLLLDQPITHEDQDEIGFGDLVDRLATLLTTGSPAGTFVVGLFGRWGSGKSSILNLLRKKLDGDTQVIVVSIDPWLHSDPSAFVLSFFERISQSLIEDSRVNGYWRMRQRWSGRRHRRKLAKGLKKLSRYLSYASVVPDPSVSTGSLLGSTAISRTADRIAGAASDTESQLALLNGELANLAVMHKTRLVCLLDDLDRLTTRELLTVLKLVRHVASLRNISYVLALDDVLVRKQLSREKLPKDYLDKFVQVTVRVPALPALRRTELLTKALAIVLAESGYQVPDNFLEYRIGYGNLERVISAEMPTLRDRAQVANALRVILSGAAAHDTLNPEDASVLAIVSAAWPDMYGRVQEARDFLVSGNPPGLVLDQALRQQRRQDELRVVAFGDTPPVDGAKPLREDVLGALFPAILHGFPSDGQLADDRINNRICSPDRFDWYFYSAGPTTEVPDFMVDQALERLVGAPETGAEEIAQLLAELDASGLKSVQIKLEDRVGALPEAVRLEAWNAVEANSQKLEVEFLVGVARKLSGGATTEDALAILEGLIRTLPARHAINVAHSLASSTGTERLPDESSVALARAALTRIDGMKTDNTLLSGSWFEIMQIQFRWQGLLGVAGIDGTQEMVDYFSDHVSDDINQLPKIVAGCIRVWTAGSSEAAPLPAEQGGWAAVSDYMQERIGLEFFDTAARDFLQQDDATISTADPHGLVRSLVAYRVGVRADVQQAQGTDGDVE